jgi:DNA-binding NtrC family response regulator
MTALSPGGDMARYPRCALVVEPNESVRLGVYAALESLSIRASRADTARQGLQSLPLGFDLILINVDLSEGTLELVEAAFTLRESPTIFVTGSRPDPQCVFELAKAGAHAYLAPPVSAAMLQASLRAFTVSSHLMRLVRPLVGHLGMKEIQTRVRQALLLDALARSNGSRRSAAQLLGVTRPAIQKWLRSLSADGLDPAKSCDYQALPGAAR